MNFLSLFGITIHFYNLYLYSFYSRNLLLVVPTTVHCAGRFWGAPNSQVSSLAILGDDHWHHQKRRKKSIDFLSKKYSNITNSLFFFLYCRPFSFTFHDGCGKIGRLEKWLLWGWTSTWESSPKWRKNWRRNSSSNICIQI